MTSPRQGARAWKREERERERERRTNRANGRKGGSGRGRAVHPRGRTETATVTVCFLPWNIIPGHIHGWIIHVRFAWKLITLPVARSGPSHCRPFSSLRWLLSLSLSLTRSLLFSVEHDKSNYTFKLRYTILSPSFSFLSLLTASPVSCRARFYASLPVHASSRPPAAFPPGLSRFLNFRCREFSLGPSCCILSLLRFSQPTISTRFSPPRCFCPPLFLIVTDCFPPSPSLSLCPSAARTTVDSSSICHGIVHPFPSRFIGTVSIRSFRQILDEIPAVFTLPPSCSMYTRTARSACFTFFRSPVLFSSSPLPFPSPIPLLFDGIIITFSPPTPTRNERGTF